MAVGDLPRSFGAQQALRFSLERSGLGAYKATTGGRAWEGDADGRSRSERGAVKTAPRTRYQPAIFQRPPGPDRHDEPEA